MTQIKHQDLCALARLKSDRALTALSVQIARHAEIVTEIEGLIAERRSAYSYAESDVSFGPKLAKIDARCENQTRKLTHELQAIAIKIVDLKTQAARDFGRVTVLEKLLKV